MCGIAGAFWREGSPDTIETLLTLLSVHMDGRGGHSYGYFADGNVKRGLGKFHESVSPRDLRGIKSFFMHARYATVGARTEDNSHPFLCGNILGAHNGAVYNHVDMNKKYDRKFDVDSPHIFAHINEGKSLMELEGYGAIEYVEVNDKLMQPKIGKLSYGGDLEAACIYADKDEKVALGVVWASTYTGLSTSLTAAGIRNWRSINVKPEKLHYIDSEKDALFFYDDKGDIEIGGGFRRGRSSFTQGGPTAGPPTTTPSTTGGTSASTDPKVIELPNKNPNRPGHGIRRYTMYGDGYIDEGNGIWKAGWPPMDKNSAISIASMDDYKVEKKKQKEKKDPRKVKRAAMRWYNGLCAMCTAVRMVARYEEVHENVCGWCMDDLDDAIDAKIDPKRILMGRRSQVIMAEALANTITGGGA